MHIILWDSICLKSPNFWKDGLKLLLSPDTVLEKKKMLLIKHAWTVIQNLGT